MQPMRLECWGNGALKRRLRCGRANSSDLSPLNQPRALSPSRTQTSRQLGLGQNLQSRDNVGRRVQSGGGHGGRGIAQNFLICSSLKASRCCHSLAQQGRPRGLCMRGAGSRWAPATPLCCELSPKLFGGSGLFAENRGHSNGLMASWLGAHELFKSLHKYQTLKPWEEKDIGLKT